MILAIDGVAPVRAVVEARSNHRYVTAFAPGITVGHDDADRTPLEAGESPRIDLRSFAVGDLVVLREEVQGRRPAAAPRSRSDALYE